MSARSGLRRLLDRGSDAGGVDRRAAELNELAATQPQALPRWLRRRLEPASAWWTTDPGSITANLTDRTWTRLGISGAAPAGLVDPTGSVWPGGAWPAVDWWVGVQGAWRSPAAEPTVRQSLVDSSPVVETRIRVPGGDVVHTTWAVPGPAGLPLLVIDVSNETGTQIGVAVGVTPLTVVGHASPREVTLDGPTLAVDGRPLVRSTRPPSAVVTGDGVDALLRALDDLVEDPAGPPDGPVTMTSGSRRSAAAMVFALGTGAGIRLLVDPQGRTLSVDADDVPSADDVARGWAAQADRGAAWDLPEGPLDAASTAGRRHLLAAVGDVGLTDLAASAPGVAVDPWVVAARRLAVVTTAARMGWAHEVADQVAAWSDRQRRGGAVGALDALAELAGWSSLVDLGETDVAREFLAHVVDALSRIEAGMDRVRFEDAAVGWWWSRRGESTLLATARALAAVGEAAAAGQVADIGQRWTRHLDADEPSTLECHGEAILLRGGSSAGLHPALTLALAREELMDAPAVAAQRLEWVLGTASATWAWPTVTDARSLTGVGSSDGHDPWVAAELLALVVDALAVSNRGSLELARWWPDTWDGIGLEVHRLPIGQSSVGFAIRWHGERPAVLWELTDPDRVRVDGLTVPGLDPAFSSPVLERGEALLEAPERSSPVDPTADVAEVTVTLGRSSTPGSDLGLKAPTTAPDVDEGGQGGRLESDPDLGPDTGGSFS